MQTIYLDISNKSVIPAIHAKQGDVGRKFLAILSDGSVPYVPTNAPAFSVFYEGDSGSGNYTHIGDKPAFEINGNKVTVELIEQMVTNAGGGVICLVLNDADGAQLAFWNIEYYVEEVPGFDSEMAKEYYTAFSKAVENLPYPDATLTGSGKAADAKAVGDALKDKAPLSHITDTSNPHEVTAEQVGARTADWMPTAEDVGARPDDWMPSADDVGAIPAEEKGAASGVATLDENGLVPGEQVNAVVPGGTLLWEGSWESGDLTVENADKFKLFQILMSGQGTTILAARTNQHIRGIGGHATAAPKIYTYHFTATVAENTWSLVSCNSMVHNPGSSHDEANGKTVASIYGLC